MMTFVAGFLSSYFSSLRAPLNYFMRPSVLLVHDTVEGSCKGCVLSPNLTSCSKCTFLFFFAVVTITMVVAAKQAVPVRVLNMTSLNGR